MAIEHSMDRAFGRQWDVGEAAQQPLADFANTPAGMFVLHIQNVILHLKGKLVSVAIGTPASVGQPLHPAFLITIEDLVAGLARNAELPAQIRHRLPSQSPSPELNSFIHDRTLLPRHPLSSQQKGESVTYVSGTICYLCVGSFTTYVSERTQCRNAVAFACLLKDPETIRIRCSIGSRGIRQTGARLQRSGTCYSCDSKNNFQDAAL